MQRGYSPVRGRGGSFPQPPARGGYQQPSRGGGGGGGTFVQVQPNNSFPQAHSSSSRGGGGGNNPYVKDLGYDDYGLCNQCGQGHLTEKYSSRYLNYYYQCSSCKSYGGSHPQSDTDFQSAAHAIPETTPPNSQRGFKRPCLEETQAPEEEEEEEEDWKEQMVAFVSHTMTILKDIDQRLDNIDNAVERVRLRLEDVQSEISALSPTQEVKKEDYDRLVARSTKEAESLKKASDSLPTTKRAKKEESS